jgi:hypothetical protein
MSVVILLGAGASYGSGPCDPHRPPLGKDLFAKLQQRRGAFSRLPQAVAAEFERDFETGMHQVRQHHDQLSRNLLREMAGYFAQFAPLNGNHYFGLVNAISRSRRRVVVASLNYDLLFEGAASQSGHLVRHSASIGSRPAISVLKIHGSCNFLPAVPMQLMAGVEVVNCTVHVDAPVRIGRNRAEVLAYCNEPNAFPPAIALYAPGKEVLYCPEYVSRQQREWETAVREARLIIVVGVRLVAMDQHIWLNIARSTADLAYVGSEADVIREWAASHGKRNVASMGATFEESLPLIAGRLSL